MASLLGIFFGGPWELLIVALVILLLFGHRLPGMMRSVGKSVVEFKKGVNEIEESPAEPTEAESTSKE